MDNKFDNDFGILLRIVFIFICLSVILSGYFKLNESINNIENYVCWVMIIGTFIFMITVLIQNYYNKKKEIEPRIK